MKDSTDRTNAVVQDGAGNQVTNININITDTARDAPPAGDWPTRIWGLLLIGLTLATLVEAPRLSPAGQQALTHVVEQLAQHPPH